MPKPIHVVAIDMDACLFNKKYQEEKKYQAHILSMGRQYSAVLGANYNFLTALKKEKNNYAKTIAVMGGRRQSYADDLAISRDKKTELGFKAIQEVSEFLDADHDPFLLADVYGEVGDKGVREGISFFKATSDKYKGSHANWVSDNSQISVLYAQMHKMAKDHPNEPIVFDYYNGDTKVLQAINDFYSTYKAMLPGNLTLRLNFYQGGKRFTNVKELANPGGIIDDKYADTTQTITRMMAEAHLQADQSVRGKTTKSPGAMQSVVDGMRLGAHETDFSYVQKINFSPICDRRQAVASASQRINRINLKNELLPLKWTAYEHTLVKNAAGSQALIGLHNGLQKLTMQFNAMANPASKDYKKYKMDCVKLIKKTKDDLGVRKELDPLFDRLKTSVERNIRLAYKKEFKRSLFGTKRHIRGPS